MSQPLLLVSRRPDFDLAAATMIGPEARFGMPAAVRARRLAEWDAAPAKV